MPVHRKPAGSAVDDDLDSLERTIAALEAQRGTLGDEVVSVALQPLLQRREVLQRRFAGERRKLVTVLFADLVDFTGLSAALDPEDTRGVVHAYFERWRAEILAAGGVVEKFIGDAVMAVFGLHRAREDDAEAAIRCALAMSSALPALNAQMQRAYGVTLAMRVGIDTGEVVVGAVDERLGGDFVAVGDTVNRASRLESAAPVNGVLVSADTYRHVRGIFSVQPVPGLQLKGVAQPSDAYLVLSARPRAFQLDPARGVEGVETRTVGREIELRVLQERFYDVLEEERWRIVTVVGDAGVGKTRLLLEFDRWLGERPGNVWWFRGRAAHSTQNHANALLRDLVATRWDILDSDPPDLVRAKCRDGLAMAWGENEETLRRADVIAVWLGFEIGDAVRLPAVPRDPAALRDQAAAVLAGYLGRLAEQAPVVVLLEDLHWSDDGSIEWLDTADALLHTRRVLVVATARPALLERRPHWSEGLEHHARLALTPLSRRESRALLGDLLRRVDRVPPALADLVVNTAEGNPFYIEELVTWLLETGVLARHGETWHAVPELLEAVAVPATLQGLLQARLDALPPFELATLQRAAVIGRVFWDEAVRQLDTDPAPQARDTNEALEGLRRREVVHLRERSAFDSAREFLFRHALLRDVTYGGVLRQRRRTYHGLAADWLEATTERIRRTDEYAALIAEHLDAAQDARAAGWYLRAGRQAARVHALAEATRLLDRALHVAAATDHALRFDVHAVRETVLDRMADRAAQGAAVSAMDAEAQYLADPERDVTRLLARARWLFEASDYAGAGEAAREGGEVAAAADLRAREAEAQLWLGKSLTWAGSLDDAAAALNSSLEQASAAQAAPVVGEALRYLAIVESNLGRFSASLSLLERARAAHAADGDQDGESTVLAQFATTYYHLGRFAEARSCLEQTLPIFRMSGHRYREAVALGNLAAIASAQGQLGSALRWTRQALDLAVAIADTETEAMTLNSLGQLEMALGGWEEAERCLRSALAKGEQIGSQPIITDSLMRLALSAQASGRPEDALRLAERALGVAANHDLAVEGAYARLGHAYVLLALGRLDEAQASYARACQAFERLEMSSLSRECRAGRAVVLARQGDHAESIRLVTELLPHLDAIGLQGTVRPGDVLWACWYVLDTGADPRCADVLNHAHGYLRGRVEELDDDTLSQRYLSLPVNAELMRLSRA